MAYSRENCTHSKGGIVDIILKYSVKITEKPMLWCIITAITKIKTSDESCNFAVISRSLCVNQ